MKEFCFWLLVGLVTISLFWGASTQYGVLNSAPETNPNFTAKNKEVSFHVSAMIKHDTLHLCITSTDPQTNKPDTKCTSYSCFESGLQEILQEWQK